MGYSYFGARYYDSDLSVFLSCDGYAIISPSESPYCYAGNNPINFIDINGGFKWPTVINDQGEEVDDPDLIAKYPLAYKYLADPSNQNGIARIGKMESVQKAIIDNTAPALDKAGYNMSSFSEFKTPNHQLTGKDIEKAFTPGEGPELMFTMSPGVFPLGGPEAGGYNESNEGKLYLSPIQINEQMLIDLEHAPPGLEQLAVILVITSTIIHEYSEYFANDNDVAHPKIQNAGKEDYPDDYYWGAIPAQNAVYLNVNYSMGYQFAKNYLIKHKDDENVPMF